MGLPAFRQEFEELIASLPSPPAWRAVESIGSNLVIEIEAAALEYHRGISDWRLQTLQSLSNLQELLRRTSGSRESESRAFLEEALHKFLISLDLSLPPDIREGLNSVGRAPRGPGLIRSVEDSWTAATAYHVEVAHELRDRMEALVWDSDPEAHGGQTFSKVDDLIAALNSLAGAVKLTATPRFVRAYKKLPEDVKAAVNEALRRLKSTPGIQDSTSKS